MILGQADIDTTSLLKIRALHQYTTLHLVIFKMYKESLITLKAEETQSKDSQALKSRLGRSTAELTNLFVAKEQLFNNAAQLMLTILNLNLARETSHY